MIQITFFSVFLFFGCKGTTFCRLVAKKHEYLRFLTFQRTKMPDNRSQSLYFEKIIPEKLHPRSIFYTYDIENGRISVLQT